MKRHCSNFLFQINQTECTMFHYHQSPLDKFKTICGNARLYNKKDVPKKAQECKELLKSYSKCMCIQIPIANGFSPDLLHFVVTKCKQNCGLCQYKNPKDMIRFMSNFGYHAITKIMPIAQIIGSFEILEHVIQNHLHEMPKCDVVKIVEKEKDPLISEKTMSNILDAIHQTEDIAQILRLNAYILLKAWIKEPSIIEDHWDALYHFVLELHRTDRASIFEKTDLQPLFQYKPAVLFALAFNCAIQTRTYYFVNFLVDVQDSVHIGFDQLHYLERFPADVQKKIFEKMENLVELISLKYQKSIRNDRPDDQWELCVFPANILESMVILNGGSDDLIEILMDRHRVYVVYEDEHGEEMGVDEGGLTRDLYTTFAQQIRDKFEDVDGYLMPKRGKTLRKDEWYIIGAMIARSVFCENISPGLNLHPILVYLMLNGNEGIKPRDLLASLRPFSIDCLDYMSKILDMPAHEYEQFMDLQGEDPKMDPRRYVMNCIMEKYVSGPVRALLEGFYVREHKHDKLTHSLQLQNFHAYLCGTVSYNIQKANPFSLKENLDIFYSDEDSSKMNDATQAFTETLVEVLDHLNKTDVEKLKAFLKFWYGTSSIQSFDNKKATVQFLRNDGTSGFDCFESSTCFYKLYVYQKIALDNYRNKTKLREKIVQMIDTTLANQALVETAGLNMQQS